MVAQAANTEKPKPSLLRATYSSSATDSTLMLEAYAKFRKQQTGIRFICKQEYSS